MPEDKTRSLEFAALGLGQAGGNLAAEFHRRAYPALALNTAKVDLRGLDTDLAHLPKNARHYIGLNDLDGAGKDPAYGQACIKEHADKIRTWVKDLSQNCDVLFLCAGLGGGTGSSVAELRSVLESLQLPIAALLTLPGEAESGIVKVNAVRAASELMSQDMLATIFVDNQRILDERGSLDLLSYYPVINRSIVEPLHTLNTLNSDPNAMSLRSFDGEDLRKVLLSGGIVSAGSEILEVGKPPISTKTLLQATQRLVNGGTVLAAGLPMSEVAYLGAVLVANENFLRKTQMRDFEALAEQLKKDTGGGAIYLGLYRAEIEQPVLHIVAGSLSLPERVREVLGAARSEGHILANKISADIPGLDVVDLADMQLFRAAGRSTIPPRAALSISAEKHPPAPAPRLRSDNNETDEKEPRSPMQQSAKSSAMKAASPAIPEPEIPEPKIKPEAKSKKKKKKKKPKVDSPVEMTNEELQAAPELEALPELVDDDFSELQHEALQPMEVTAPASDTPGNEIDYEQLQTIYTNLIERYRSTKDRAVRENVARKLIRDARSDDVEVRAHSIWAMVSLGGQGFKAALEQALNDPDDEIRGLAEDGIQRLNS